MVSREELSRVSNYIWEIPKSLKDFMRVPARFYTKKELLDKLFEDRSLNQLINITSLPGIVNHSLAMPDMHEGYGFPIGGVAAVDFFDGVISPGGVGYDINCGMRLLKSPFKEDEIQKHLERLADAVQKNVPSGLGRGREKEFSKDDIERILEGGAQFLVEKGFGEQEDIENCEEKGKLKSADSSRVSDRAKKRGQDQVGTLGSGNHFCEIQKVEKVFSQEVAKEFGLFEKQVVVMIHTGSRGLGHQIATDYIKKMGRAMKKYNINLPDRELACCPLDSPEGKDYLSAMACGANYAWANRQMIAHFVRKAWRSVLGEDSSSLETLYDVAHNIAKIEEHETARGKRKLCVHRKGATRAFPPNHPQIPSHYQKTGQPVLIPGSMGTASYVLVGTDEGEGAFWSTCHGAGRTMSRTAARKRVSGQNLVKKLKQKGIIVKSRSFKGIAEEAPLAYKNVDEVVDVVHEAGLSKKVVKLKPLAVIKGE
ncbi:MAG: RNA-splicing ligase RtcB [Candidatus Nealsonbacteria bacterium]|nr:RNA-splicing ligase RtcB [Candidatus Nealsonbacteria bacterium]